MLRFLKYLNPTPTNYIKRFVSLTYGLYNDKHHYNGIYPRVPFNCY